MNPKYKKDYDKIKDSLGIEKIISVRFSDTKTSNLHRFKDTPCTALARSLKNKTTTYIDRTGKQLCAGADFFLDISHPSDKEIHKAYIQEEKVFKDSSVCSTFLKKLPRYPTLAKKNYILLTPLAKEQYKPDVVLCLANPAQVGRILGLASYEKLASPLIVPAVSTCASIFLPIKSGNIHINFIDYYDRYYQGKEFWDESDLIVSMPFNIFREIIKHIPLSAHGNYQPKMEPQKVDSL